MYLPRFTRFSPGLDGGTETTCDHVAVQTAGHGRAVSEAAVEGTRAWTAVGHREVQKEVSSIETLISGKWLGSAQSPVSALFDDVETQCTVTGSGARARTSGSDHM